MSKCSIVKMVILNVSYLNEQKHITVEFDSIEEATDYVNQLYEKTKGEKPNNGRIYRAPNIEVWFYEKYKKVKPLPSIPRVYSRQWYPEIKRVYGL